MAFKSFDLGDDLGDECEQEAPPQENGRAEEEDAATKEPWTIDVVVKPGHPAGLVHVQTTFHSRLTPANAYKVFINPDNSGILRDIKAMRGRKVLRDNGNGDLLIEVEQLSELKFLWVTTGLFGTLLHVDQSETAKRLSFKLARPGGFMRVFEGTWTMTAERNSKALANGIGCRTTLTQVVTPNRLPQGAVKLPFIKRILCGISSRGIKRFFEDLQQVERRLERGETLEKILASPTKTAKYKNAKTVDDDINEGKHAVALVQLSLDVDVHSQSGAPNTRMAVTLDVIPVVQITWSIDEKSEAQRPVGIALEVVAE